MKRMRRQRLAPFAAAAVAGLLLLTACSSSGSGGTKTTPAPGTTGAGGGATTQAATGQAGGSLFDSLPAKIQKAGKIVVGSAINYPPFENYGPDGKTLVGFEVELASQLEKVLGVKFDWNNASFDTLFASLKADRYDIVYGATNDTAEREQSFDMVDYIQASQGFVVAKGNPKNIKTALDLCGKTVSAVTGGVQPQWLRGKGTDDCKAAGKDAINVLTFADASGEQLAVRSGKADAMMENFPTAVTFAKESGGVLELVPDLQVLKTYFAMVVPKSDSQLSAALQKAWDAIIANGSYGQVLAKWGLSDIALTQAYLNGATSHPPAN